MCVLMFFGLVMAGSADLKDESKMKLDQRLQSIILATIDISYGGENGFNQAIKASEETISSHKSKQDQKPLTLLLSEIAKESNKYVFGLEDTIKALFDGLVETLIVLNNLKKVLVVLVDYYVILTYMKQIIKNMRISFQV